MDHQNKNNKGQTSMHIPVLLDAVLETLAPEKGNTYLDATAGFGGHAEAILERTFSDDGSVLVDQDEQAIEALKQKFEGRAVEIMRDNFVSAAEKLHEQGKTFDIILADIGVSSVHLDNANRGFSIKNDGPLDMRMDQSNELTAETIVNTWKMNELIKLLQEYGEEYKARRIVDAIMLNRPIKTTGQLATVVAGALPGKHAKVHPATKTFQALRIAVNNELDMIEQALPIWVSLLNPGGRLGVITFHSLEDRIVKRFFKEHAHDGYDAELKLVTKKAIGPDQSEIVLNPRSRSAKLRVAVKIKKERGA
jgi:16S rRNA (cytosine1402-N4)-methyltransferase